MPDLLLYDDIVREFLCYVELICEGFVGIIIEDKSITLSDGVEYSSERLEKIADQLKNFQFAGGQEVDGASARFLAQKLKGDYKEF